MQKERLCEEIIRKQYQPIYRYCMYLLNNNIPAAEDCTQTVFTLMIEKKETLDFSDNICGWLYAAAERICRDYLRKEQKRLSMIAGSLDENTEISSVTDEPDAQESVFDVLTDEEYTLLEAYYTEEYGRRGRLAASYGLSPAQLFKRIHAIRNKLRARLMQR